MRLLYIANIRLPTEKAHGVHIVKMCEALANTGAEVMLLVQDVDNPIADNIFSYYDVKENFSITRLPIIEIPLWIPGAFMLRQILFVLACKRWARMQGAFDVLYTRGETAILISRFAAKRAKFIWETHIKPARLFLYHKATQRAALIVTVTKKYAEEIPQLWNVPSRKVMYAPDSVSLEPFQHMPTKEDARAKLGLPLDKKIVLYTGSDVVWKGLYLLREASELLPDDAAVVFVGDIKETMAPSPRRLFMGSRPHATMPLWLAAADVLVLTGDPASEVAKYYTSPLKLFEYMAAGRPVVATDLPATRDVLSEGNAYLAEPTPEGLARSIREALAHPTDAAARAAQARRDVEQYTWEARARAIVDTLAKS